MARNKPKSNRVDGGVKKVSQMDICQTPPYALDPLLPFLDPRWVVWESAAGPEQLIVKTLQSKGFDNIIATDLLYDEKYNYFTYEPEYYDIQITNMPFSIKYEWLALAFQRGVPFALLAPYETTFAKEWQDLLAEFYGKPYVPEVVSPERRINYKMPHMGWGIEVWDEKKGKMVKKGDSAQMPTAWITWGLNVHAKTTQPFLRTYYMPMETVKYDAENNPIAKVKRNARSKKAGTSS